MDNIQSNTANDRINKFQELIVDNIQSDTANDRINKFQELIVDNIQSDTANDSVTYDDKNSLRVRNSIYSRVLSDNSINYIENNILY